jgi:hypothetical protein
MHGDEPRLPQEAIAVRHVCGTIDDVLQHDRDPLFAWQSDANRLYMVYRISSSTSAIVIGPIGCQRSLDNIRL